MGKSNEKSTNTEDKVTELINSATENKVDDEKLTELIHAEMQEKVEWGQIINKTKASINIAYNGTNITIPSNGTSKYIRKDYIEKVSSNANYLWKRMV